MNNRLNLFRDVFRRLSQSKPASKRKLYTDSIYPYPHNYYNNKKYPSRPCYRETWPESPWYARNMRMCTYMFRIFWTYFFYNLYNNPGAIIGHFKFPDPKNWTDEELGIPPDSEGSYVEWLERVNVNGREPYRQVQKVTFGRPRPE